VIQRLRDAERCLSAAEMIEHDRRQPARRNHETAKPRNDETAEKARHEGTKARRRSVRRGAARVAGRRRRHRNPADEQTNDRGRLLVRRIAVPGPPLRGAASNRSVRSPSNRALVIEAAATPAESALQTRPSPIHVFVPSCLRGLLFSWFRVSWFRDVLLVDLT
jgi:hypothetical protein